MVEEAPKPLVYSSSEGQLTTGCSGSITYSHGHPIQNLLAIGDTAGHINIYEFNTGEQCKPKATVSMSSEGSCRILNFLENGKVILSGSEKGQLSTIDIETATITCSLRGHKYSPYCVQQLDDHSAAIGDDGGCVKVWDMRSAKATKEWRLCKDFISDLSVGRSSRSLLATSGDGRLYKLDWREEKHQHSDSNDSELLCVDVVKSCLLDKELLKSATVLSDEVSQDSVDFGGDKVVCGDGEGALMVYSWGLWEDITDRFPVHSDSVDCLLRVSDSVVCTGCMDGWVRSIHILPNQLLGLVGQHVGGFPVEHMCLSHDQQYLITSSQDSCHFWPLSQIHTLPDDDRDGAESSEEEEKVSSRKKKRKRKQKHVAAEKLAKHKRNNDFFSDL